MTLDLYLAYVAATLILLAIPGPTVMLVVSYSLTQGYRSATASILGVGLGDATAAIASLLGLGAILAASATLFSILKWVGAAYLIWIGIKMWRSQPKALKTQKVTESEPRKVFLHTYIVTALNPKGIVFFMAFLPHFVVPESPLGPQLLILGATFVVLGVANAAVYAFAAAKIGSQLRSAAVIKLINRLGGGFLISAGLMTANLQRS